MQLVNFILVIIICINFLSLTVLLPVKSATNLI